MNKKYLFLIILLAAMAAFSGCQKKPAENAVMSEQSKQNQEEQPISTSSDEIDTSDWLTYRNEEYGFKINYPKDWEIKEEKIIKFLNPCFNKIENNETKMKCYIQGNLIISKTDKSLNLFIEDFKDDFIEDKPLTKIVARKNIQINNIPATKLIGTNALGMINFVYIYIANNNSNFIISHNENVDIFNKMVSSFSF